MCWQTTCKSCKKKTWGGCGGHSESLHRFSSGGFVAVVFSGRFVAVRFRSKSFSELLGKGNGTDAWHALAKAIQTPGDWTASIWVRFLCCKGSSWVARAIQTLVREYYRGRYVAISICCIALYLLTNSPFPLPHHHNTIFQSSPHSEM